MDPISQWSQIFLSGVEGGQKKSENQKYRIFYEPSKCKDASVLTDLLIKQQLMHGYTALLGNSLCKMIPRRRPICMDCVHIQQTKHTIKTIIEIQYSVVSLVWQGVSPWNVCSEANTVWSPKSLLSNRPQKGEHFTNFQTLRNFVPASVCACQLKQLV